MIDTLAELVATMVVALDDVVAPMGRFSNKKRMSGIRMVWGYHGILVITKGRNQACATRPHLLHSLHFEHFYNRKP